MAGGAGRGCGAGHAARAGTNTSGADLQPLASPNPLDPLVVDEPACSAQQLGDLAVAVASVLPSKLDDVGAEPLLVVSTTGDLALRRAMLAERRAGATLGYTQLPANVLDADPATRGA